jgi:hypothetical protein
MAAEAPRPVLLVDEPRKTELLVDSSYLGERVYISSLIFLILGFFARDGRRTGGWRAAPRVAC